jgi:hypothetical protein
MIEHTDPWSTGSLGIGPCARMGPMMDWARPRRPIWGAPEGARSIYALGTDLTTVRSHPLGLAAHRGDLDRAEVRAWASWWGPRPWA